METTASGAILRLLRDQGGFVSGETISRELCVSRTAIWKQINTLRNQGYVIEAVPSRGYLLKSAPDVLTVEEIATHLNAPLIGRRLICRSTTISTNADAFKLAEEGADEGTVVLADCQSGGKGRMGRVWASPAGVNLYFSVILRPAIMPFEAPQLTFLSAVAVARAIEKVECLKPRIKWPNDVLLDGRKVAGLLNEMSAETDGVNFVILGVGINLNMTGGLFPENLRHPATSLLLESGKPVARAVFAASVLVELDRLYAEFRERGFGTVREEWRSRCNAYGRELVVQDGDRQAARGMFAGIDGSGALLVRVGNGEITRILSGDVRIL